MVYSLWFMEGSDEIRGTVISQSVGRVARHRLVKILITDY